MSLYLDGTVDPVAAQGQRQVDFIPRHFKVVNLGIDWWIDINKIRNWIWINYSGRFFVGQRHRIVSEQVGQNHSDRITAEFVVAFEDSSEAIMFSFVAPTLKNNDFDLF